MATVRTGKTALYWESHGQGDPVLMVMGLASTLRGWQRLLPYIAEHHRVIVFDNRGTGKSSAVRRPFSLRDLAADASTVLDAAGEQSAHVVGASMGGMVAQHLALEQPQRVRSLILGCTQASYTPFGRSPKISLGMALRPVIGHKRAFSMIAPALYSQKTRDLYPDRIAEDLEIRINDAVAPRTAYAQLFAVMRHNTRNRLSSITAPTLVVHGLEDGLIDVARARYLAANIPNAELALLPDCAHILTTDAEVECAEAMLDFIGRQRLAETNLASSA